MCDFQIFVKVIGKGSDPPGARTKRYFFLNISTFRNLGFVSVTL
jgi:hypothetical protein